MRRQKMFVRFGAKDLPYDTYTYDYRENVMLTPAPYVPNGRITG